MTTLAYRRRSDRADRRASRDAGLHQWDQRPRHRRPQEAIGGPRAAIHTTTARAVGAILLLVFLLALQASWIWALIVGAAGYYVARLLLLYGPQRAASLLLRCRPRKSQTVQYPLGYTAESVRQILGEARSSIARIRTTAADIRSAPVHNKTLALCETAERIVEKLSSNPSLIGQARRFLTYYLDAAQRIVSRYAELACGRGSADISATLDRVEPALDVLCSAFSQQFDSLLRDDALDLDAELSVLRRTVQLDGLLDDSIDRL